MRRLVLLRRMYFNVILRTQQALLKNYLITTGLLQRKMKNKLFILANIITYMLLFAFVFTRDLYGGGIKIEVFFHGRDALNRFINCGYSFLCSDQNGHFFLDRRCYSSAPAHEVAKRHLKSMKIWKMAGIHIINNGDLASRQGVSARKAGMRLKRE